MKPKLGSIIPSVTDKELSGLTIEKVILSKTNRTMKLVLENGVPQHIMDRVSEEAKKAFHLHKVFVSASEKKQISSNNTMIYIPVSNRDEVHPKAERRSLGHADVSDMLYGRPIKDSILSISSIGDNSGRVTFSGRVFAVDEREITSKKTNKEFHLLTMDITDNTDSISGKRKNRGAI